MFTRAEQEAARREREVRALVADESVTIPYLEKEIARLDKERSKIKRDDVSFGECYDPLGWYTHRKWVLEDAIERLKEKI